MVAPLRRSESPTHNLARRLHAGDADATSVEIRVALRLSDARACGDSVVADINDLAEFIDCSRYAVMQAIKKMRRMNLIAAEFFGLGEQMLVIVMAKPREGDIARRIIEIVSTYEHTAGAGRAAGGEGTAAA